MEIRRFRVVLDANVLFPMLTRDVLLSLAEADLYTPRWSSTIHDEWMRNVVKRLVHARRLAEDEAWRRVERVRAALERSWPDASVEPLPGTLPALDRVPEDDRHVVLTAIAARADAICTANLAHFPSATLAPLGLEAIHPDDFIRDLADLDPVRAVHAFRTMRARLKQPPMTVQQLAERLGVSQLTQTALWVTSEPTVDLI